MNRKFIRKIIHKIEAKKDMRNMSENEYRQYTAKVFSDIIGAAFQVQNHFGPGMDEIVYEAGLFVELGLMDYSVTRQEEFPIYYKGYCSGINRKMDVVMHDHVMGNIVLELKALDYIGKQQRAQICTYMKLMNMHYGVLINFGAKGVYTEKWMMDEHEHCIRID